jgi:hypothetical protein
MRTNDFKASLAAAIRVSGILLAGSVATFGQQQINLTAGPSNATMPDGSTVPMWGYTCGAVVTGSTATCAALNKNAGTGWSPVVITVPTTQGLQINLTNSLSFTAGTGTNTVPTSLVIVGQLGGGLGSARTTAPSPAHAAQGVTWSTVNTPGGTNPTFNAPGQNPRVQSFATEVAAGTTASLTWAAPRPGTYLIESGTHPSIQGPMGLYGILVVTAAPAVTTATPPVETAAGTAYTGVTYDAEIPLLFSEIDPLQNNTVQTAVSTVGFSETMVWSGQPGGCGNPSSATFNQCYPPAVNYTPLYYLINGVGFNKASASASLFAVSNSIAAPPSSGTATGNVLVRLVNAGLRMHVPSIVGSLTGATTPVSGFSLVAEDGNPLPPTLPRVQSDVFMAAGKTFDVMINGPATGSTAPALPIYDRELSLSGNAVARDAGMLAYIGINGAGLPAAAAFSAAVANNDTYNSVIPGQTLSVSDPSKGVIANDINVYGVKVATAPGKGTLTLYANGTFTYVPNAGWTSPDTFVYQANGNAAITATVTLATSSVTSSGITVLPHTYTANTSIYLAVKTPGVLAGAADGAKLPLTLVTSGVNAPAPSAGLTLQPDANGGFTATALAAGTYTFTYHAQNSQGTVSPPATATLIFPQPSNLQVTVVDGSTNAPLSPQDYRWVIEEDRTFYIDPTQTMNTGMNIVPTLGVNFHTSYMPFVAQGCTGPRSCEGGQMMVTSAGTHVNAVCDVGNGVCRPDTTGNGFTAVLPSQVVLDPTKRYYISVLPGDAADPFYGYGTVGHGMGGAPIGISPYTHAQQTSVTVISQPSPYPPGKLSVFVFEDDFPLNGEQDAGGGIDVLSPNEPGLGGFQIHLWDAMGGNGDFTGQMTYDMFNQPLTNSLDGTIDPATTLNACPITKAAAGITGMIVTCPKYESDGKTLSPLAGQAVINNLMPGRWGVIATPGADRIARGEEWLQTNTLDGQKAHDSFTRIGEPSYFQEFGPAGYHVSIGFANPAIINSRLAGVCNGTDPNITGPNCGNTVTGKVTSERLSRTPDERLYSSGSRDGFYWTQCFVSLGDPDGEDFAFTKCNADGTFTLSGIPDGNWRITTFDQWNDQLVDGLSTPIGLTGGKTKATTNLGDIAATQWQTNLYTRTFVDDNKDGISQSDETGIPFANVAVRLRDGSLENFLVTDFTGTANFNETFPLFSWYTVETDTTRYKNTGIHVVYDAGGPADGSLSCGQTGYPPCGNSIIGKNLANTAEQVSVPTNLRVPGAVYCAVTGAGADCVGKSIQTPVSDPPTSGTSYLSTGRIDPPWVGVEGWQGFPGQNSFLEFGKEPYVAGENGGIKGHVVYASTRPFDDPQMLVQTQWEPLVPHVTINLYQEGFASDNVTPTLTLVDTTQTSSWDDWAQGFRADGVTPNMNCPGQGPATGPLADLFYFSLYNQPNYLDLYSNQHNATLLHTLPSNSQFKCYDGMHNWNQIQPAPYDGMYQFPSVTSTDPTTGKPNGTNCSPTVCKPNTVVPASDLYYGLPMLPIGKYVVEVVVPPGFELVKEEDKNILIGDNFISAVPQQFGGLGNIFILPDQAQVAAAYNANNAQNPTQSFGATPENGIVPSFVPEPVWPCVGELRTVPDYISLYPQSKQVSPFAGASRHLCDRKEVTLSDQMGAIAKFFIYTSTHIASKFTGGITDDYTSEFDPFSPQFGEKFAPPDLPVSVKDWTGAEISRVYADHWGAYDGMTYSTWEVNPPNPTGYSPTVMVFCMNDPGPVLDTNPSSPTYNTMITDPQFTQGYSQFCYGLPFMPGTTQYLDTPVVPTAAFAGAGYNNVDCAYPDATPAVKEVDGDGVGPYVSAAGNKLTITALGDQSVPNNAYSGPSFTTAPYNQKTINRHYGFGAQCTSPVAGNATCNTHSQVTIGGVPATITSWGDLSITVTVPNNVPACAIQQQAQYAPGATAAQCGELVITAGNGKQSVDAVTVTIGGKAPNAWVPGQTIQSAIDSASPGDLIMVPAGTYNELLLMWKPVRLQGVGAASTIVNANTHPAGKLDPWRRQVNCLFGLALNGTAITATNPYDSPSDTANSGGPFICSVAMQFQVDRLPLEATVGWNATLNGNLAELLQEPTLMGALEGAGITVLSKGVNFPAGSNPFASDIFPTGTTLLKNSDCTTGPAGTNLYPSNFQCNPSRIDGLGITNSSQGGGGIFVHAWGHNLEIANNRIYGNSGTLSGGVNVGQGEFPPPYIQGSATNAAPGSCQGSFVNGVTLPYCHNLNVNVHNNSISSNSATGDEMFSATPAGAGGISFCTGADFYKFNYNWVCGNLSSGDGGGFGHLGFSYNGDIEHNTVLFNQSLNPTIPANGGGILIMGAPDVDPPCSVNDLDCAPNPAGSVGPSDGAGPQTTINANLIMGNSAESGSGGGIRLQNINGSDVVAFPTTPSQWNHVTITNNIIANNVAGWDGGGISALDALNTDIINNTIVSNNTTASAGILFNTLGAPLASASGSSCTNASATSTCPQPAGLVSIQNSAVFTANLPATITCPSGHYSGTTATNGTCRSYSYPLLANNVLWQNSAYYIGVGALSPAFQQNVVSLYNAFTGTAAASQTATGSCPAGASYWDLGVRGDAGPHDHTGGLLGPTYSLITDTTGYDPSNISGNPAFVSQYCNGSRIPPEACTTTGGCGWQVPPGISDATVPNPIFNLTPVATVDEGNNWVNMRWGPLTLVNAKTNATLANYAPTSGSPAIDAILSTAPTFAIAPTTDFFGNPRFDPGENGAIAVDIGAIEFQDVGVPMVTAAPTTLTFTAALLTTSAPQTVTLTNAGGGALNGINVAVTAPFSRPTGAAGGTCGTSLGAHGNCTINVVFTPTALGAASGTLTVTATNGTVNGSPVTLSGTGANNTVTVAPATLAFGNWATGTTSPAQTLTVTNTSSTTLTGVTVTFAGGTPQPFSRPAGTAGGTCTTTIVLAPNATCTINVVFAPTTAASFSRTVAATIAGATVTPATVALTGAGVAMAVTPASLTFAAQAVGTPTALQTLTVRNSTGGTRTLTIAFTGPFSRATLLQGGGGTCGTTLANSASCTINVVFTPTAVGSATGTAAITTNGGFTVANSPVALSGTGVTPGTLSFTSATNGTLSTVLGVRTLTFTIPAPRAAVTSVVTVRNTGTGSLQITNDSLSINIGSLYSVTGTTCSFTTPLAPNGTCTISIRYATPATRPLLPDIGALAVNNNGSGTTGGVTPLALVAQ